MDYAKSSHGRTRVTDEHRPPTNTRHGRTLINTDLRRTHAAEDVAGGGTRAWQPGRAACLLVSRVVAESSGDLRAARSNQRALPPGGRESSPASLRREFVGHLRARLPAGRRSRTRT